jgi:uncharacterized membrane protein YhaH (DUF805 family)
MNWYLQAIRQYADFSGRARRKEYWMFFLYNIIFLIMAILLDIALDTNFGPEPGPGIFYLLYALFMFIPSLALSVRRLHDTGKSGWSILFGLIPIAGPIVLIVFYLTDSEAGINKWGPNPKEEFHRF